MAELSRPQLRSLHLLTTTGLNCLQSFARHLRGLVGKVEILCPLFWAKDQVAGFLAAFSGLQRRQVRHSELLPIGISGSSWMRQKLARSCQAVGTSVGLSSLKGILDLRSVSRSWPSRPAVPAESDQLRRKILVSTLSRCLLARRLRLPAAVNIGSRQVTLDMPSGRCKLLFNSFLGARSHSVSCGFW